MARIQKDSVVPFYFQLSEILKTEISSGVYSPDKFLPSERMLCNTYSVSRATVRQAVQILKEQGLIEKLRGVGTRILRSKVEQDLLGFHNFDFQMKQRGYSAEVKLLNFDVCRAPSSVQSIIRLNPEERVTHVFRLRLVEEEPLFLERIYLPESIFPNMQPVYFESTHVFGNIIQNQYNIKIGEAQVYLEPIILDAHERRLLKVDKTPAAGLLFERVSYDDQRHPLVFTKRVFRGDRCRHLLRIHQK